MANPWVRHWDDVTGTSGKGYRVSQRQDGKFGCNCPTWMYCPSPKIDCQHILKIQLQLLQLLKASGVRAPTPSTGREIDLEEPKRKIRFED